MTIVCRRSTSDRIQAGADGKRLLLKGRRTTRAAVFSPFWGSYCRLHEGRGIGKLYPANESSARCSHGEKEARRLL